MNLRENEVAPKEEKKKTKKETSKKTRYQKLFK